MDNVIPFRRPVHRPVDLAWEAPVTQHALFVLRAADTGIRLTTRGNFNRQFTQEFWKKFVLPFNKGAAKPSGQEACPELIKIQFMLEDLNWIAREGSVAKITPGGLERLRSKNWTGFYGQLLVSYIDEFNWACEDQFPEFDFIQDAGVDLLDTLLDCTHGITPRHLFEAVFNDYKFEVPPFDGKNFSTPQEWAACALRVRFIERFCIPFGLLTDPSPGRLDLDVDKAFERTELLNTGLDHILEQITIPESH